MVRYQRLTLCKFIKAQKNKVRMVCYQKLPPQNFIKTRKIRYEWYVIKNFDPINALKLKNKVRMGGYKTLLFCTNPLKDKN